MSKFLDKIFWVEANPKEVILHFFNAEIIFKRYTSGSKQKKFFWAESSSEKVIFHLLGIKITLQRYTSPPVENSFPRLKKLTKAERKALEIKIPEDLVLQLGFNNNCNSKCRFCTEGKPSLRKKIVLPDELLYKYLLPLYPKTYVLLPAQGEITVVKEGYDYIKFLGENYPNICTLIETNGIAFDNKWQELAIKDLLTVKFSLNASNKEEYVKNVWDGEGGDKVYDKISANFESFMKLLEENNLMAFKPEVSSVIDSNNYHDILPFLAKMIRYKLQYITFLFNTREHNVFGEDDVYGNTSIVKNATAYENALRTLFEVEKLLQGRVSINFRLFIPDYPTNKAIEDTVKNTDIEVLKEKYSELYALSEGLNMQELYEEKSKLRLAHGQKQLTLAEEFGPTIFHQIVHDGKPMCANPWRNLRFNYDGYINLCCIRCKYHDIWHYKDFVKNGKLNWLNVFNSDYYKQSRYDFMAGEYDGCLKNCPAIKE